MVQIDVLVTVIVNVVQIDELITVIVNIVQNECIGNYHRGYDTK